MGASQRLSCGCANHSAHFSNLQKPVEKFASLEDRPYEPSLFKPSPSSVPVIDPELKQLGRKQACSQPPLISRHLQTLRIPLLILFLNIWYIYDHSLRATILYKWGNWDRSVAFLFWWSPINSTLWFKRILKIFILKPGMEIYLSSDISQMSNLWIFIWGQAHQLWCNNFLVVEWGRGFRSRSIPTNHFIPLRRQKSPGTGLIEIQLKKNALSYSKHCISDKVAFFLAISVWFI